MTLLTLAIGVLWALPVALVCVILGFIGYAVIEWKTTRSEIFNKSEGTFENLLRRGEDGAFIQFTDKRSGRFIRFEKYHRLKGYGIALAVPEDWPRDGIVQLTSWCDANGLKLQPRKGDEETEPSFLQVDCGKDTDRAYALAREVWFNIFGLTDQTKYRYTSGDISPYDGLVNSPDYASLTKEEKRERQVQFLKEQQRTRSGENPSLFGLGCLFYAIIESARFISIPALPISTLLAIGDPADWSMAVGTVTVAGSTASLCFFLVFLASGLISSFYDPSQTTNERIRNSIGIYSVGAVFMLIMVSLPTAVVAVWIGA